MRKEFEGLDDFYEFDDYDEGGEYGEHLNYEREVVYDDCDDEPMPIYSEDEFAALFEDDADMLDESEDPEYDEYIEYNEAPEIVYDSTEIAVLLGNLKIRECEDRIARLERENAELRNKFK